MANLDESDDVLSISSDESSLKNEGEKEVDKVQQALRNRSHQDNFVHLLVTCALLWTAVPITVSVYIYLLKGQQDQFENAYEQYSKVVSDALLEQQIDLRAAFSSFATNLAVVAITANATWPFFNLPLFESHGSKFLSHGAAETLVLANLVTLTERSSYMEFAESKYKRSVEEGHELAFQNLERLDPIGYHGYATEYTENFGFVPDDVRDEYFCASGFSPPPPNYQLINWNMASGKLGPTIEALKELQSDIVMSAAESINPTFVHWTQEEHSGFHGGFGDVEFPHTTVFAPVHEQPGNSDSKIVAIMSASIAWDHNLQNLLPLGISGIDVVIRNNCDQTFSYKLTGEATSFTGVGDWHNPSFNRYERVVDLTMNGKESFNSTAGHCQYKAHIFPNRKFESYFDSYIPKVYSFVVLVTFVSMALVFCFYDVFVQRRDYRLVAQSTRTNAIVESHFPEQIRKRLLDDDELRPAHGRSNKPATLIGENSDQNLFNSKPMADLFLETTVMFADIVGFTAWASVREPSQVFTLLETVYSSFDEIAKIRRVFKVETVGDCYVAVTGLPDPRKDHAVAMARFARDCLFKMHDVVRTLEVSLGPDTGELSMRIGIHSGPVTAGVLRGERSRFQLFGDTMNTAARIESTSARSRIQVSQETADLLVIAGKRHWIERREGKVHAKGKGSLQTFWLTLHDSRQDASVASSENSALSPSPDNVTNKEENALSLSNYEDFKPAFNDRTLRLIDWNVDMLLRILKQIVARRSDTASNNFSEAMRPFQGSTEGSTVFEEVSEIITLPEFDSKAALRQQEARNLHLAQTVRDQLHDYVTCIASMYRNNPFHNFDHASHVAMSVSKLMSRIVAPSQLQNNSMNASTLHDHTYGITSDPLTQFSCAFSALIHDADHTGVPNTQLLKENVTLAHLYKNKSVAEQNSFDLAWDLLMDSRYTELRETIYRTREEMLRFRQLVVNGVMATDIVDKELKELRNARWAKAFSDPNAAVAAAAASPDSSLTSPMSLKSTAARSTRDDTNRKATIVIEHLIQASDVAHTMQHWHIYRTWNEKLFSEMYQAYQQGRAEKDPTDFWYQGELGFFDFYIIPLARKLKDCGVFGVSSDEYLTYALRNRQEWASRGREIVAEMVEKIPSD